tara:strand:- start:18294 stop:19355 length:1062 start_codon:yes stop_codon:yes gene_type:complete
MKLAKYTCYWLGVVLIGAVMAIPSALAKRQSDVVPSSVVIEPNDEAQWMFIPRKRWSICFVVGSYTSMRNVSMNFGVVKAAKSMNLEAHTYELRANRAEDSEEICSLGSPDGIIVAGDVTEDWYPRINRYRDSGVVVVGLNSYERDSPILDYQVINSYYSRLSRLILYIQKHHQGLPSGREAVVLWLPGSDDKFNSSETRQFILRQLRTLQRPIKLVTRVAEDSLLGQSRAIHDAISVEPDIDYVIGTSQAAHVASKVLGESRQATMPIILSFEMSPQVYRDLARGAIQAVTSDPVVVQAGVAVATLVRALENRSRPEKIEIKNGLIQKKNLESFISNHSLAPTGYRVLLDHY